MKNILINDGLSQSGKQKLIQYGFEIIDQKINPENLIEFINTNNICAILVRSSTEIRKQIIDSCPSIKLIGRGGVGLDNIDVDYAKKKGIDVINTPTASSKSVSELVFAHLFSLSRFLFHSNRTMPLEGDFNFKTLKSNYSEGIELGGKTIGIIGFGKIGQEVAKIACGLRMKVIFYDKYITNVNIEFQFDDDNQFNIKLVKSSFSTLIQTADFITIHVPKQDKPLIKKTELSKMKKNVIIINTSRGGIIDEADLVDALNKRTVGFAGLDVYENEPKPSMGILMNEYISLSPHIGASTHEAQDRIGIELANQINKIING